MANNYPITLEEMSQMQGVGIGKAKKFGADFIDLIDQYVKENNIERPSDMVIKTIVKKSSNKVNIIQSLDKKLSIEDIARGKGLNSDELIKEIETIVESGTKLDLQYMLDQMIDDYEQEELFNSLKIWKLLNRRSLGRIWRRWIFGWRTKIAEFNLSLRLVTNENIILVLYLELLDPIFFAKKFLNDYL